jgi:hypothetical protein
VYAMAFPDGGSRLQISIDGGESPTWSPQGDELFFLDQSGLMVADVDQGGSPKSELIVGRPRRLMKEPFGNTNPNRDFNITSDGKRFLATHLPMESMPRRLRVVVNWFTELEAVADGGN